MKRLEGEENGTIALEASIALTLFIFLMVTLYSFLSVFEVQYAVVNALISAGKSMAMETYATEKIMKEDGKWYEQLCENGDIATFLTELFFEKNIKNRDYVSYTKWYEKEDRTLEVAKQRFCAYFGDGETQTNQWLKARGVENGFQGLDFSGTKVEGKDLIIQVSYENKLVFDFPAFKIGKIKLTLSSKSALWK